MKQVLVTTGATVTFTKLIKFSLNPEFVKRLLSQGYTRLVIQYGKSSNSLQLVKDLLDKLSVRFKLSNKLQNNDIINVTLSSEKEIIKIRCISFDRDLVEVYTAKSDLVISHAGTGSILDSLRLHRKLIVLINEDLKDNHQLQIARAFEQQDVLSVATGTIDQFISLVSQIETHEFKHISQPNASIVEDIIWEEVS